MSPVTQYVQTGVSKADELEGSRKDSVGFALTSLQRRLASSPEAIFQSLKRRRERLQRRLREEKLANRGGQILAETLAPVPPRPDFKPAAWFDQTMPTQQVQPESLPDRLLRILKERALSKGVISGRLGQKRIGAVEQDDSAVGGRRDC